MNFKLNKKSNQQVKFTDNFETIIGETIRVDGNLLITKSVRVDGILNGNIIQSDGAEATVAIAKNAVVTGDIRAHHVVISGKLIGNVLSQSIVELLDTAEIKGNVNYLTLSMEIGAKIQGQLTQMSTDQPLESSNDVILKAKQKLTEQ